MRNSIKVSLLGLAGLAFAAAATPAAAGPYAYNDPGYHGGKQVVKIIHGRHGKRIKQITTYDGHGHKVRVVHVTRRGRNVVWQHPRMRQHLHQHQRYARHHWDPAAALAFRIIDRAFDLDRRDDHRGDWNRADRVHRDRQAQADRQTRRNRDDRRDRRDHR